MKAFKTFAQAPEPQRPEDINLEWPWQVQECTEQDQAALEALGFTVVSDENYTGYLAARQTGQDTWFASIPPVLVDISPRQIRLALVMSGIALASIDALLDAMSDPARSLAIIEWQHALAFKRNNALVISIGTALGLTAGQIDDIWILAATL